MKKGLFRRILKSANAIKPDRPESNKKDLNDLKKRSKQAYITHKEGVFMVNNIGFIELSTDGGLRCYPVNESRCLWLGRYNETRTFSFEEKQAFLKEFIDTLANSDMFFTDPIALETGDLRAYNRHYTKNPIIEDRYLILPITAPIPSFTSNRYICLRTLKTKIVELEKDNKTIRAEVDDTKELDGIKIAYDREYSNF